MKIGRTPGFVSKGIWRQCTKGAKLRGSINSVYNLRVSLTKYSHAFEVALLNDFGHNILLQASDSSPHGPAEPLSVLLPYIYSITINVIVHHRLNFKDLTINHSLNGNRGSDSFLLG